MKPALKKLVDLVIRVLTLPMFAWYRCLTLVFGSRKAFTSVMQAVSLLPGVSGEWLRRGVLQWVTCQPMENACISFGVLFSDPGVVIGNGVYIGPRCDIGKVAIGDDTIVASNVQITSGARQHGFDRTDIPIRDQAGRFDRVVVGSGCWIGSGAVVCAGVGNGAVVGAGSVVIEDVPDWAVVTGNPARVVRIRK